MARIIGTNGDDKFPDELEGTSRADEIFGLAGDDALIGFGGDDVLEGGAGADELFGSNGFDYASYRSSPSAADVRLSLAQASGGDATGDTLFSIEGVIGSAFADFLLGDAQRNDLRGEGGADVLAGFEGDDALNGGAGNDLLDGGAGNDRLSGGNGNDELGGGAGNDELRGGAGIDTAYFSGVQVDVDLASGTATDLLGVGDQIGSDRLFGVENVLGTPGGDLIGGSSGANMLAGSTGGDLIYGAAGADRFVYYQTNDSAPAAADLIVDFSRVQGDRIDLQTIDANEQAGGNQAFRFIGQAEFTAVGQLRSFVENGDTVIEANTTDLTAGAELRIELDPMLSMQASDFLL